MVVVGARCSNDYTQPPAKANLTNAVHRENGDKHARGELVLKQRSTYSGNRVRG